MLLVLLLAASVAPLCAQHGKTPFARSITWGLVVFMLTMQAVAALTSVLALL